MSESPGSAKPRTEPHFSKVGWAVSPVPVTYPEAVTAMDHHVRTIREEQAAELIWLLEHPSLYTAGTGARAEDLLISDRFAVHETGRGGQYTYHGPGQRVAYVMLDLSKRRQDVRWFVNALEAWLIAALARLGVEGERRPGHAGVWVKTPDGEATPPTKIAALGIRLRRWVSFHGISLNVAPDLDHFNGIVPCGITDARVTSLAELGVKVSMSQVDRALRVAFEHQFGCRTEKMPPPVTLNPMLPSPQRPNL